VLLGPKDYKRLKHGKDAPFDADLQYLKQQLLAQALVHHKFVMDLPDSIWINEKTGKTAPCRVMAVKAYSRTQAKIWYVNFTIISHADQCDLQLPVRTLIVLSLQINAADTRRKEQEQAAAATRSSAIE
jgi:hypothetical protein